MTSICDNFFLAEVWLIHADQMSLYNFIILRKKETPAQVLFCGIGEAVVAASENT